MKGTPESHWTDTADLPRFPRYHGTLEVDAVVIGSGITGATAAYLLKQAGAKVALVDRGRIGGIDTKLTTAHLTVVTDERLHRLVDRFGRDTARLVWEGGQAAIDQIHQLIDELRIDCGFRWVPGYLHLPWDSTDEKGAADLRRDADLANELGFQARYLEHDIRGRPAVEFAHQALFHPLAYLARLLEAIPGTDCHVFEHSAVTEIVESPLSVRIGADEINCRFVVLATHTPLMGTASPVSSAMLQTKLSLYSSYALGARVPSGVLAVASYWDTSEPYRYLRVDPVDGGDYAIFGGADHKTGQDDDTREVYRDLTRQFQALVPEAVIDRRWSGQVIETNDGLPFIGETGPGQFAATGFAGNGMTFGTLGAMMARDRYLERDSFLKAENPWAELFHPERKTVRGGTASYLKENADYPYYYLRDRLVRSEAQSVDAVRPNSGMIVSLDGEKTAAFRDIDGTLTLLSPVCPHLGCIVAWNDAEHTWDCPCHGSRFSPEGAVITGPAESDLKPVSPE